MSDPASRPVSIPAGGATLRGELAAPPGGDGVIAFIHGSGSSRTSPRNQHVARELRGYGFGTLLFDLLTDEEDRVDRYSRQYRFDIALLVHRVRDALSWLRTRDEALGQPLGLFGASTGAAAALIAAATVPGIGAVVSRGGRPDSAGAALERVRVPTLLIVGGDDDQVLALNRAAYERLPGERWIHVVPGATHLFEEPGALDEVIEVTARWFREALPEAPDWREAGTPRAPSAAPKEKLSSMATVKNKKPRPTQTPPPNPKRKGELPPDEQVSPATPERTEEDERPYAQPVSRRSPRRPRNE